MSLPRLGVRSRLLLAVGGALAIALAAGLAGFSLLLDQRLSSDADSLVRAQAEAEAASLAVRGGRLAAPQGFSNTRVGAQTWVFGNGTILERPRASADLQQAAQALAGGPQRAMDIDHARLFALPATRDGRRYGTVVSAVSLEPYEESERTGLVAALLFAVGLLGGVLVITRWILGRALLPVSRMTEDAAAWSEHDVDRRFELGEPYDELTRLAATLDALLNRLAASVRHEQRLTAELSHELRTPLARISAEAQLALSRPRTGDDYRAGMEAIGRSADQMTRTIDALMAAARQEARVEPTTSDAREAVELAVEAARPAADARGIELRVTLPATPLAVALGADLLERIVQPVLDNAVRYGTGVVEVGVAQNGAAAVVTVRDDGPGVEADERTAIFEPGMRGAAGHAGRGAGLGLPLAQRLARTAGGDVVLVDTAGGATFAVRVPLA
ncbi:MAG: sensor histidine kinase [Gaiellaceae bacterium]